MNSCLSECWRHVYFLESITVQWFTSICFYLHSHWLQFYHLTWLCSLIGGEVYPRKPPALRVTPWYKADGVVLPGEESSEWFVCFLKINLSLLTDQDLSSRIDVSRCHHGEQSRSHPPFGELIQELLNWINKNQSLNEWVYLSVSARPQFLWVS